MIGLLVRALPFWVREPLLAVFGVVFSGFLFYAAIRDSEWAMAGLGAAVVVFTAIRIYTINRALEARRLLKRMEGMKRIEGI
ncbi:hypothetical protein ACIBAH_06840 [Streptomyces sp. NPDC051445]|uniref:hypothetical protein n=1 Tax=unclassified Streptomyces TaxID=2593676 RepID=UPI00378F3B3D